MNGHDGKTVLVVDDDVDLLALVASVLREEGFEVSTAENGREALDAVSRGMPDLILLDMKMPVMNGWEFSREFRTRHGGAAPILVLSAADDARKRAAEIGADGLVSKPFELDALLRAVDEHIRPRR